MAERKISHSSNVDYTSFDRERVILFVDGVREREVNLSIAEGVS